MNNFEIICDVCCDLNSELRAKYNIKYVSCHYTTPSGEKKDAYCDWDHLNAEEFYTDLKKNPNGYSTSPASPLEFQEAFENALKEGKDVLAMAISTGLSGTYAFMCEAKDAIKDKYPDRKIFVCDTLRYSTGFGLMAVYASIKRSEGLSIDETFAYLEENKNRFHQMGFLDDLSFVAKKGRISKPKAFMGQLVGIKPFGEFSPNGLTTILGQTRGDKNAIKGIVEYMKRTIENPEEQLIFIASTNRDKQANILKEEIIKEFKPKEVIITKVYVQDAINIGPGLMNAVYFGTKISEGLVEEKKIFSEITGK